MRTGVSALAVVVTLAGGWMVVSRLWGTSTLPAHANFVCVVTGEQFRLSIADVGMIPARRPDNGQRTLVPCVTGADGQPHVDEHYRAVIEGRLAGVNRCVDVATLGVHRRLRKE